MKQVVMCLSIPDLSQNLTSHAHCGKYPGAGWIPYFCQELELSGLQVVAPHQEVKSDAYLVVEEMNQTGFDLLNAGRMGGISLCLESKLYQPFYYDYQSAIKHVFKHMLTFEGGTEHLKFPSYYEAIEPLPWETRKGIVLVMANKFVEANDAQPSKAWAEALRWSLQTDRYNIIDYLGDRLDLYGKGWDTGWLPNRYVHMKALIDRKKPKEIVDKIGVLSLYQYAVCFENVSQPGYITEKIIDCFAAGVIPIYLGAPDIERYIPKDCYIDMRRFGKLRDLELYLGDLSPSRSLAMIQAGRDYLASAPGQLHQYERFGKYLAHKVKEDLV